MMIQLARTDSNNPDFIALVRQLDAYLAEIDGEEHAFYAQFNKTAALKHVIMAYEDGRPAACGAVKELEPGVMEVKRMYTIPAARGKGLATQVLTALENWAAELQYKKCRLETGNRQAEAIALYKKNGYQPIPNYGQYAGIENSVCFEKELR